jgi:uncharacterized membrane protein (UPF0127 family)
VLPQGFPTVTIEVTKPDGTKVELCVLLADNEADRSRGLMDVTSLGRYGGMLFRWDEPTNSQFYMLQTRIPLSIAWFAEDGSLVSTADMVPCPNDDDDPLCPRYSAARPYLDAIELPKGGVEAAGITTGSKLTVLNTSC